MIEYEVVKLMWRSSKKDLIPMFVTFLFCLAIGVEYGILLGVGTNLMFLLYPSARPTVHVDKRTVSGLELTNVLDLSFLKNVFTFKLSFIVHYACHRLIRVQSTYWSLQETACTSQLSILSSNQSAMPV